jgi:hypothetical protein
MKEATFLTGPGLPTFPGRRSRPPRRALGLAFLGCLAWFMVTVLEGNWSEDDIKEEFSPKITVIQGTRPGGDKASCFGVVVSRHHVVAPLAAVVYRSPKIESVTNQGDRIGIAHRWSSWIRIRNSPCFGPTLVRECR